MSEGGGFSPERGSPGEEINKKFTPQENDTLRVTAQRDQYEADREARAEKRNKGFNFWQRIFGKKHTEKSVAHEEALEMDRVIGREKKDGETIHDTVRRVSERPEFRLVGEPRFALDAIVQAIDKNNFSGTAKLIEGIDRWEGVSPDDVEQVRSYVKDLVTEHARELVTEKDGKHFVNCVSYIGGYIKPDGLPRDELESSEIKEAVRNHAVSRFRENFRESTTELAPELKRFSDLGLLPDEQPLKDITEINGVAGQELIDLFKKKDSDYAQLLVAYMQLVGKPFEPEGKTREKLSQLALDWVGAEFKKLEGTSESDPRESLVRLSNFMTDLEYISERQVRENPELLQQVKDALQKADSYQDPDDAVDELMEETIDNLRETFMGEERT